MEHTVLETAFKLIRHNALSHEMQAYAKDYDVPIIKDDGLETMLQFLRLKQPKRLLEIGSAIAYSSIMLAQHLEGLEIVTIERDEETYLKACEYIQKSGFEDRIQIFHADALDFDVTKLAAGRFDVIFIDAAKSAYQRFFEKYEALLGSDGLIISDNLLFHGHVFKTKQELSKNLGDLVRKLKTYSKWLAEHEGYDTIFLPLGDGMAFSYRRGK